jgi:hypothetical protein
VKTLDGFYEAALQAYEDEEDDMGDEAVLCQHVSRRNTR